MSADFSGKLNNDGFGSGRNETGGARKGSEGVLAFSSMLPMLPGGRESDHKLCQRSSDAGFPLSWPSCGTTTKYKRLSGFLKNECIKGKTYMRSKNRIAV